MEYLDTPYTGTPRGKSLANNRLEFGTHLLTFAGESPPGDLGAALKHSPHDPNPKYELDIEC